MIGFQHPPQHTQFKKGQSGNPKGRPKKHDARLGAARSANALALKEAERPIKVREGEDIREISAIEAVLRAQLKSATSGSPYAQRDFIARYDAAEQERCERIKGDCEFWELYVAIVRKAVADAEEGESPPTPLPHPDDVVIDYEKGVSFIGPIDEEQAHHLQEYFKQRESFGCSTRSTSVASAMRKAKTRLTVLARPFCTYFSWNGLCSNASGCRMTKSNVA
jgi:hypothetical protein